MSRLFIATRGFTDWRGRLASPEKQWKRRYSAFETAVSWEKASRAETGIPGPVDALLQSVGYAKRDLMFGVVEHTVKLPPDEKAASQCDVWAVVKSSLGMLSISVEAKAKERFGDKTLEAWLDEGKSPKSRANHLRRWEYIQSHLPDGRSYLQIRYQILHRCAAAVIEAKRFDFQHAAFVVQAFKAPDPSFQDYAAFCRVLGVREARGGMAKVPQRVRGITLCVGWADCEPSTDPEVASAV